MLECAFEVVMFHFVEAIHVELPDETVHLFMPEVSGEDDLLKLHDVLDDELTATGGPVNDLLILLHLRPTILTPKISKALLTKPATSASSCYLSQLWHPDSTLFALFIGLAITFNYIFYLRTLTNTLKYPWFEHQVLY